MDVARDLRVIASGEQRSAVGVGGMRREKRYPTRWIAAKAFPEIGLPV